jgi:transposase
MEHWKEQQRVTCVHSYYETKSMTEVQHVFRWQFNVGRHGRLPSRNTILAWVKKFEETGSVFVYHDYSRIQTSHC